MIYAVFSSSLLNDGVAINFFKRSIAVFLHFYDRQDLKYNIIIAATAEEEISGSNGVEILLKQKDFTDALGLSSSAGTGLFGIVGEPTQMNMAIAERGLLVLDCIAEGKAGHAAREEGENAIYNAMKDIEWFCAHQFERISPLLGSVKMTVTSIETPSMH